MDRARGLPTSFKQAKLRAWLVSTGRFKAIDAMCRGAPATYVGMCHIYADSVEANPAGSADRRVSAAG